MPWNKTSFHLVCFPRWKSCKGSLCADDYKHRRVISQLLQVYAMCSYCFVKAQQYDTSSMKAQHHSPLNLKFSCCRISFCFNQNQELRWWFFGSPAPPTPEFCIKLNSLKCNGGECSLWNVKIVPPFHSILFQNTDIR